MLNPFHADAGVEFSVGKWEALIEVRINIVRLFPVDVRAHRPMAALAQPRRQQAVARGNVQDVLGLSLSLDDLEDDAHVAREIGDMGEFGFQHEFNASTGSSCGLRA